jgi:hypothetical protein
VKPSTPYEAISAVLAFFGAFLLAGIYMPLTNPGLTRLAPHYVSPSLGYYIAMTPIPLVVLAASWYFNRKAQALKGKPPELTGKFKWIFFAFMVLAVLYALLS